MSVKWIHGFQVDPKNEEHMIRLLESLDGQGCVLCAAPDAPHIYQLTPEKKDKHLYAGVGGIPESQLSSIYMPLCADCLQQIEEAPTVMVKEIEKRVQDDAARARGEK